MFSRIWSRRCKTSISASHRKLSPTETDYFDNLIQLKIIKSFRKNFISIFKKENFSTQNKHTFNHQVICLLTRAFLKVANLQKKIVSWKHQMKRKLKANIYRAQKFINTLAWNFFSATRIALCVGILNF